MNYLFELLISFAIACILVPVLMKASIKLGFTDKPTKRKKHSKPIPLCGGIAIYIGFFIPYFLITKYNPDDNFFVFLGGENFDLYQQIMVFIGSTLILGIGLVDDFYKSREKEFPIYPRFIIQIISAIIVYSSGIFFRGVTNPITGQFYYLPSWIQLLLTVTWIFGVTTVINWSDGMDGLAGGLSVVSSVTFFLAALILGQNVSAVSCILLAGAILGFLVYNRYPAKVYMGDSGANLIGFLLSIIALDGAFKQTTVLSIFIPILALAVPIFDNLFVIFKRFKEGNPVYQADRSQMHYRLERKGFTKNQVVLYIISLSIFLSAISILLLLIKQ